MFMFLSLLAASVDGFVCGFTIGTMGVKFRFKDFIRTFCIIFMCCCVAAVAGNLLAYTKLQFCINILGVAVMLGLGMSCLCSDITDIHNEIKRIDLLALSVAADAGVVCLYLAMCGYNIVIIAFISAFLHSRLMAVAAFISNKVIKEKWIFYTRYVSGLIFLCMAFVKLINLQ